MSHNFKPGDLVLITEQVNFGRCAEIISRHAGPCRIICGKSYQEVPDGMIAWVVAAEGLISTYSFSGVTEPVDQMGYSERWLMPLRGDFIPEQQKAKEAV